MSAHIPTSEACKQLGVAHSSLTAMTTRLGFACVLRGHHGYFWDAEIILKAASVRREAAVIGKKVGYVRAVEIAAGKA